MFKVTAYEPAGMITLSTVIADDISCVVKEIRLSDADSVAETFNEATDETAKKAKRRLTN